MTIGTRMKIAIVIGYSRQDELNVMAGTVINVIDDSIAAKIATPLTHHGIRPPPLQ